jgi:hypothetical protein
VENIFPLRIALFLSLPFFGFSINFPC